MRPLTLKRALLMTLVLLTGAHACAAVIPLPALPGGTLTLRVAHVVNPRLPRITDAQLSALLAASARTAKAHWGVTLRFAPVVEMDIATLFDRIPAKRRKLAAAQSFDFKSGHGDPDKLARAYGSGFKASREPLAPMVDYARSHGAIVDGKNYTAFGASMAQLQLSRIAGWQSRNGLDGQPVMDAAPYNEYPMWVALGYGNLPFELLITNQIIAGAEYIDPAVHTALRGGYSNGITSYSRKSRFLNFSVWSTYAYTGNDDALVALRGGERYTPDEVAELAGVGAAHELGHQLLHLLHPFGNAACVMNPVPLFSYREWAQKLKPADCALGSSPAMTPGAYKPTY